MPTGGNRRLPGSSSKTHLLLTGESRGWSEAQIRWSSSLTRRANRCIAKAAPDGPECWRVLWRVCFPEIPPLTQLRTPVIRYFPTVVRMG